MVGLSAPAGRPTSERTTVLLVCGHRAGRAAVTWVAASCRCPTEKAASRPSGRLAPCFKLRTHNCRRLNSLRESASWSCGSHQWSRPGLIPVALVVVKRPSNVETCAGNTRKRR